MATVVVVDDETMNADALAFMLSAVGLTVRTAADGEAGLRLIAESHPDLVITDFMMPVMTGLELAQKLQSEVDTAAIPVILLTAAQADIGRRHPHLFDAVFEKPCLPSEILAAVSRLLEDSH
ncbi:response regulator [Cupriavidus numazuensis]|uniref:Regulator of RpoS n=1 Tax=Cupriavidus numazuensis TaxID=221992 RepID=A0ABM8TW60_9BURK|nr:response regulator [Cupriavidus numazuensis]CAG2160984.1 Regulator of RpoS [Cupriavidus numazuensis]